MENNETNLNEIYEVYENSENLESEMVLAPNPMATDEENLDEIY